MTSVSATRKIKTVVPGAPAPLPEKTDEDRALDAEVAAKAEDPVIAADLKADQEAQAAALVEPDLPVIAGEAPEYVPDESEIDPSKIPYGQTVMSKQGRVCSTAPDPRRIAQAQAVLEHGANNSRAG